MRGILIVELATVLIAIVTAPAAVAGEPSLADGTDSSTSYALGWEESDEIAGVEYSSMGSEGTSCVPSVRSQFDALKHHAEPLAFWRGNSPDPSLLRHYQGIQRLPVPGAPLFYVSRNNNPLYIDDISPAGYGTISLVQFGSKASTGERIRSNRLMRGTTFADTPPPANDRGVGWISFDGLGFPSYSHVGGMQLVDGVLAVALEHRMSPSPTPLAMIALIDVADPLNPKLLQEIPMEHGSAAGAVALGHHPSHDGYVMIVIGKDLLAPPQDVVYVYETSGADLRDKTSSWSYVDTWIPHELIGGDWETGFDSHQSINLIEQCDGSLFLVGTRNTLPTGVGGEDWAVLYEVSFTASADLVLREVSSKHIVCNAEAGRTCDFAAAAAPYVSPTGELILYGTEHHNDGPNGSIRMGEFRHEETYRPGSPLRQPSAEAGGPYGVVEGGTFDLQGLAIEPQSKPWIELFEHKDFNGYSFAIDWEDRYTEDLDDLDEIDEFDGIPFVSFNGFGDETSSVRWEAPPGCAFQLYADQDYRGNLLGLGGSGSVDDIDDLKDRGFDDKAHSVGFSGTCDTTFTQHAWDLDDDGTYETDGTTASFSAVGLDGPGSAVVRFRARDNWGHYVTDSALVTIHNAPPSVSFTPPGDTILEGIVGMFDLRFWDPGGDPVRVIVKWGDGTEDRYYGSLSYPIVTARHEYADDAPTGTAADTITIRVSANDDDFGTTESVHTISVRNANPIVSLNSLRDESGAEVVLAGHPTVRGERLTLEATYVDSGESDTHTASVHWGDGTIDQLGPVTGSIKATHSYLQLGRFDVTVEVTDDDTGSGTAVRTVEVTNSPPTARDDVGRVDQGGSVTVPCHDNDTDVDGDPLAKPTIRQEPLHGETTVLSDGSIKYTHDGSATTTDSFTYVTSDGMNESNPATVSLNISLAGQNQPPVATADTATVAGMGTVLIDVLDNDADPDGDALAILLDQQPAHGTAAVEAGGLVRYAHNGEPNTADSFTYRVTDGELKSSPVAVSITITGTLPPPATEIAVGLVDPATGQWHLRAADGAMNAFYYGNPGDVPFVGDWNCDTVATPGLFRTSDAFAYLRNSNTQGIADIRFFFGNPSDVPLAGDFNGDGCDTLSIYRPSEARFYIMNRLGENEGGLGAAEYSFLFGNPGDKPVVGDWDGDGIDEIGLHRESTGFFYYRNTLTTGTADGEFFFGDPGDRFVAGDWGVVDSKDTPAMFRPSGSTFYFRHSLTQGNADSQFPWNGAGNNWLPIAGAFE